ncbi:MAG: hypothetical protein PF549_04930 [Patescibacteria group bacterium]|jgi:hypothetical protein|nr:hypothetical protein [Patescibacteria group bacterium]
MKKIFYIGDEQDIIEVLEKSNLNVTIVRNYKEIEKVIDDGVKAKPITLFLLDEKS